MEVKSLWFLQDMPESLNRKIYASLRHSAAAKAGGKNPLESSHCISKSSGTSAMMVRAHYRHKTNCFASLKCHLQKVKVLYGYVPLTTWSYHKNPLFILYFMKFKESTTLKSTSTRVWCSPENAREIRISNYTSKAHTFNLYPKSSPLTKNKFKKKSGNAPSHPPSCNRKSLSNRISNYQSCHWFF